MKNKKIPLSKKVSIEFDKKHLPTLVTALEVYSRLRSGQIAMAIDTAFIDKSCIEYNDRQVIESIVRTLVFRDEDICTRPNSYYGVGCPEMKDGTVAWEIKKVIEQYLHYEQNDGYRSFMNVSGNGPMRFSDITIPKIIDSDNKPSETKYWKPVKSFKIPQRYQEPIGVCIEGKNYEKVWDIVDKSFKNKPLPRGKSTKVEEVNGTYYVVVEEPYKNNDTVA